MNKIPSNKSFGYVLVFFFNTCLIFFDNNFDFRTIILLTISVIFLYLVFKFKISSTLNNLWTKFGYLLGKIISPIVMFIVYFGTIFPIKILIVLFGKDLLSLKFSSKINSYWVERKIKQI